MGSNYKIKYDVDMVLCIDVTGSMENMIKIVQVNALNLYKDLTEKLAEKGKYVNQVRVKVVAFRDYLADGNEAMLMTDFFKLPDEADKLSRSVEILVAKGGGDDPEDGFEALAYAIKSKWVVSQGKKRHVIVLWTDDDAHELGFGKTSPSYPKGMASDISTLTQWWNNMDKNAKRLILFAPDTTHWKQIGGNWDNTIQYPSEIGNGLKETDYKYILNTICNSI